jgi:hypothetical protein
MHFKWGNYVHALQIPITNMYENLDLEGTMSSIESQPMRRSPRRLWLLARLSQEQVLRILFYEDDFWFFA